MHICGLKKIIQFENIDHKTLNLEASKGVCQAQSDEAKITKKIRFETPFKIHS